MQLKITIDLGNAAFEDGGTDELDRILSELANRLPEPSDANGSEFVNLYDVNGNHCGAAEIVDD